ncbi:hypothetical protein BHM03_00062742 [Ensete ventricosum]|nr:hypothetical protein BHM03_00062742 [Ensete ventricosum]
MEAPFLVGRARELRARRKWRRPRERHVRRHRLYVICPLATWPTVVGPPIGQAILSLRSAPTKSDMNGSELWVPWSISAAAAI